MSAISNIDISSADNGYMMNTRMKKSGKGGDSYLIDSNVERTVHPNGDHLIEHLKKKLGVKSHKGKSKAAALLFKSKQKGK
jgi:hypothetical protein